MITENMQEYRKLDAAEFRSNPYIRNVKVPTVKVGDFTLTIAAYEPGELLEYDMPDFACDPIEHRIGYFTERVEFPGIYEGVVPWMSVCPSEINSMARHIDKAHGRTLVLGLGLGYYPYMASMKPDVESIDVIECQPEIIRLFEENLLPQFPHREKIRIIEADALSYIGGLRDAEEQLSSIEFAYWIDDAISWYLKQE